MRHLIVLLILSGVAAAEPPIQPGDRIAIVGNTFADQLRIHGYLETLLLQSSQEDPVSIRNLGWGGDMLTARDRPTNFPTEESTLTAHKTDVIVACFGMGESFAGEAGLADFRKDLAAFIASHRGKKYNGESEVRLVLVSPIAYEDLGELTPMQKKRNRELEAYTKAMSEVAAEQEVAFADLFQPSQYIMRESTGPKLTTNGIHLNRYGYWAVSRVLHDLLIPDERRQPWRLSYDAAAKEGEIRFQITEETAPTLPPPTDQSPPAQLSSYRDTLTVENLKPGDYALTVDGEFVVAANAAEWAKGVAIDSSPAHKAAEEFREMVNDKNLQFTYSWKALNQVHIVGERRSSNSGKSLPAEVIEFNKLAIEREKALRDGIELKTREWLLTPQ